MSIQNNRLIAILLAVYNGENYLAEQLDSLYSQTNQDWTLYIRDDGSSDSTIKILKEYSFKYANIVLIEDELGNLKAKNNFLRLLELVDSTYYMFCDADDVWYPNKIELSFNRMKQEEDSHPAKPIIVHTDFTMVDEKLNLISASYFKSAGINPDTMKSYNYLGICSYVGGSTMLFNHLVKAITFPVPEIVPMHDFWIGLNTIRQGGIISTIHQQTKAYRRHSNTVTQISNRSTKSFFLKLSNLKNVLILNYRNASLLKKIGYGPIYKYIFYKFLVLLKIRF